MKSLKTKIAAAAVGTSVLLGTGVAYAAWQSNAVNQSAKGQAHSLSFTVTGGNAPAVADLYPGVNGKVQVEVTNNRPFAIRLESLSAGTVDTAAAACGVTSNALTDLAPLGLAVPGNSSATFTIDAGLTMGDNAAAKAPTCQGIAVGVTGITATASAFNS